MILLKLLHIISCPATLGFLVSLYIPSAIISHCVVEDTYFSSVFNSRKHSQDRQIGPETIGPDLHLSSSAWTLHIFTLELQMAPLLPPQPATSNRFFCWKPHVLVLDQNILFFFSQILLTVLGEALFPKPFEIHSFLKFLWSTCFADSTQYQLKGKFSVPQISWFISKD